MCRVLETRSMICAMKPLIEDAIQEWCSKMGVERGDKSEDEMMDYIHEYEYEDLDTYFYINKFTFE